MSLEFAIPGMMPPPRPGVEARIIADADGSLSIELLRLPRDASRPKFKARVWELNGNLAYEDDSWRDVVARPQGEVDLLVLRFPVSTFSAVQRRVRILLGDTEKEYFVST